MNKGIKDNSLEALLTKLRPKAEPDFVFQKELGELLEEKAGQEREAKKRRAFWGIPGIALGAGIALAALLVVINQSPAGRRGDEVALQTMTIEESGVGEDVARSSVQTLSISAPLGAPASSQRDSASFGAVADVDLKIQESCDLRAEEFPVSEAEGSAQGANFAGHFIVSETECGDYCKRHEVRNLITGEVVMNDIGSQVGASHSATSGLLVINPGANISKDLGLEPSWLVTRYFGIQGGELEELCAFKPFEDE